MTSIAPTEQFSLPFGEERPESSAYLTQQLLTYLGNKRALLEPIRSAVASVQRRLGGRRLRTCDAFSGSGVVSRMLKGFSDELTTIDIERYAAATNACYLANRSQIPESDVRRAVEEVNDLARRSPSPDGFIRRLYAPADEDAITATDRVFYTVDNARRLDTMRTALDAYPEPVRTMLLGPLLSAASVHANTAGVFKGFYKDRRTGVGRFGGSGSDALSRITAPIVLRPPVLSEFECDCTVLQGDANQIVGTLDELDLVYLDPPYNQHPYGSNYFMLNLLTDYVEPESVSPVSGIPTGWTRSGYNVRKHSLPLLSALVDAAPARYVLLSFNDEGYLSPDDVRDLLSRNGRFTEVQTRYTVFRGSRNLAGRSTHVTEHLYLLEKRTG